MFLGYFRGKGDDSDLMGASNDSCRICNGFLQFMDSQCNLLSYSPDWFLIYLIVDIPDWRCLKRLKHRII